LDIGSGVGDVAMLAATIVGPSGMVVGIERDAKAIERARMRASAVGISNVEFVKTDVDEYSAAASFDAAVGRYILQFLPNPVATLRNVIERVRSGGVIAFQEGTWAPLLALSRHLPLWYATISLLHELGIRAGANLEMGQDLYAAFQDAGLPAPEMRLEMVLGADSDTTRWASDVVRSVQPELERFKMRYAALGDLATLQERLHSEVIAARSVVPWIGLVAAWSRKP
jgi:SAM-dependent methyltransferase